MKKFIVLLFVLGLSTQLFANISAKQVVGKWKYTIVTDNGDFTGSLKIAEKDGKLTGEVYSEDGGMFKMTKVEIKEGNVLYFEVVPEYDAIKITVKVEGKKFKGNGSAGGMEFPLIGEKQNKTGFNYSSFYKIFSTLGTSATIAFAELIVPESAEISFL